MISTPIVWPTVDRMGPNDIWKYGTNPTIPQLGVRSGSDVGLRENMNHRSHGFINAEVFFVLDEKYCTYKYNLMEGSSVWDAEIFLYLKSSSTVFTNTI